MPKQQPEIGREPPDDVAKLLQEAFGSVRIRYREVAGGYVNAAVITSCSRMSETPWKPVLVASFAGTATRPQIEAVWRAEVDRTLRRKARFGAVVDTPVVRVPEEPLPVVGQPSFEPPSSTLESAPSEAAFTGDGGSSGGGGASGSWSSEDSGAADTGTTDTGSFDAGSTIND